MVMACLW